MCQKYKKNNKIKQKIEENNVSLQKYFWSLLWFRTQTQMTKKQLQPKEKYLNSEKNKQPFHRSFASNNFFF